MKVTFQEKVATRLEGHEGRIGHTPHQTVARQRIYRPEQDGIQVQVDAAQLPQQQGPALAPPPSGPPLSNSLPRSRPGGRWPVRSAGGQGCCKKTLVWNSQLLRARKTCLTGGRWYARQHPPSGGGTGSTRLTATDAR